jgi:hypothetical protein
MFINKFPLLSQDLVKSVEWKDDPSLYDQELHALIDEYRLCFILNPWIDPKYAFYIDEIPKNQGECIIWKYRDQWVAKLFYKDWSIELGYIEIKIPVPQVIWKKNPDLDQSMTFLESPFGNFEPEPWDENFVMVWYIDPQFNPTEDKIWVMTCEILGKIQKGTKDMGTLIPKIELTLNPNIHCDGLNLDGVFPPYWDLDYECAYALDASHCQGSEEAVWLVKINPCYRQTKGWKWLGTITPEPLIIYNENLGIIDYDVDVSSIHFSYFGYENMYFLDRKHLPAAADDVWAIKVKFTESPQGVNVIGNVSPNFIIEYNSDIPNIEFDIGSIQDYVVQKDEFNLVLTWYITPYFTNNKKIWLAKKYLNKSGKEKFMGYLKPNIDEDYDVFFLSYDEPNADENFKRLKNKCPTAKRINGVKGILEAHKKAAKQAKTSMFYVIDADCHIDNKFDFDFQPSIFDLDCTYVWHSKNPFNNLQYGYGGIKLFPRQLLLEIKNWGTDLTTSIGKKLKVIPLVSNETRFNTSNFHTWRSVFREVVKLIGKDDIESQNRLKTWSNIDFDADHADWAARAVEDAKSWTSKQKNIKQINDYGFLKTYFNQLYQCKNV